MYSAVGIVVLVLTYQYHMWMFDSTPGITDCVTRNVTTTCGEEIGSHIAEIGRRIEEEYGVCDLYKKWKRGNPRHCSVVRNLLTPQSLVAACNSNAPVNVAGHIRIYIGIQNCAISSTIADRIVVRLYT